MRGQMSWLPTLGSDGDKILHLRSHPNQPWQPYTAFPEYAVPDYKIPQGSKGWATYQKLLVANWTLIPNDCVERIGKASSAVQEFPLSNQDSAERIAS